MTDGLAAFCERISLAFWEPFSIDSTRHVGAGAPDERSVNLKLNDLRTPGCTRGVYSHQPIHRNPLPGRLPIWTHSPQQYQAIKCSSHIKQHHFNILWLDSSPHSTLPLNHPFPPPAPTQHFDPAIATYLDVLMPRCRHDPTLFSNEIATVSTSRRRRTARRQLRDASSERLEREQYHQDLAVAEQLGFIDRRPRVTGRHASNNSDREIFQPYIGSYAGPDVEMDVDVEAVDLPSAAHAAYHRMRRYAEIRENISN
ncbi:hypothetical protein PCANC_14573 [Puccinia coronata f. sp. avenae]|uniref:Uncharacterized protein n=1 Tax=Puccinia coronata f. sp. avenae TaxID=200324 RepID=A0A2N5UH82_9BASI|nr:hypothetical protein PCANC_19024 [Puccinia coronata f. sp. avenae]PLW38059.1 hypothetical protein PCANC_14573 [Puccinia coronata f. sp. avenae]